MTERGAADPGRDVEIVPDAKDWTWVLQAPCPECGFVSAEVSGPQVGSVLRGLVPRWTAALHRPDAARRPAAGVWSTLEYGAHVRDVQRIFDERLVLMLSHDDPEFANWDQDDTALAGRYDLQDPLVVAAELEAGAAAVADRFDSVPEGAWQRTGRRSNGSRFTVETLGQYFLHDVVHHLHDVAS